MVGSLQGDGDLDIWRTEDTQRRRLHDSGGRDWSDKAACRGHHELEATAERKRGKEGFFSGPLERVQPG